LDYQSVLQYLYDLTDYEKERIARYDPDTLDLSRVRRVLARMSNPHQRFPSIHIAGTKGKGSVAAMCASVLQTAGLRTGLYTSPHLHTFRERIRMNGEPITEVALVELVQECRPIFDAEPELTTFEAITALAFAFFAQQQVDFAVVEVGLGGRLDATNVVMPWVSIITSLSFDHTYLLGNTLADIAHEKAGIIKPGVPTVCAPQKPEALAVIQQICAERDSPLTLIGRDWTWQLLGIPPSQQSNDTSTYDRTSDLPLNLDGQSFHLQHLKTGSPLEGTYTISLLGRHQLNNAAVAIAALDLLKRRGIPLQRRQIRQGLVDARWPGRFEVLQRDPPLVVDCAHNGDSMAKLVAALTEWFPGRRWTFILGASNDKDVPGMLRELAPLADRLLATESRHSRAMTSAEVAELASEILPKAGALFTEIKVTSDVGTALNLALGDRHGWQSSLHSSASDERGRAICVTGSIFVVADAREVWAHYTGSSLPDADHPIARESLPPDFSLATQLRP
jgi:dihydrofolate synthase/folylpolyglutamate synthase